MVYLTYGFEQEFFPTKKGKIITLQNSRMTRDDCGFLAEAISEPSDNIRKAIAFLQIAVDELHENARKEKTVLLKKPVMKVDDELLREARQFASKDALTVRNIYGHVSDPYQADHNLHGASLQVSFNYAQRRDYKNSEGHSQTDWRSHLFDFTQLIRHLDTTFKAEIAAANRSPGFYALKDGRFGTRVEYRSLPNNISLEKLQKALLAYGH